MINRAILFLAIILFSSSIHPQETFNFPVKYFKLNNGLKVVLLEDKTYPVFTLAIFFHCGSRDEKIGKTGIAQILQNLYFQGSENFKPMEHLLLINKFGGELNAFTNEDKMVFYETLPSNLLKMALMLEADRMRSLRIDDGLLAIQKEILKRERQLKLSGQPYGRSFFRIDELAFINFAYSHPVIGYKEDIELITFKDVYDFYTTYFTPSNACLVLVGNFRSEEAISLIKENFENINSGNSVVPPNLKEPMGRGELMETIYDNNVRFPAFHVAYPFPSKDSPDFYPMEIIDYLLIKGNPSILKKKLLIERKMAYELGGGVEEREGMSLFKIFVLCYPGYPYNVTQSQIFQELENLKNNQVSHKEILMAKNQFKTEYLINLRSTLGRAMKLGEFTIYFDNPYFINEELLRYMNVTPQDISRVAKKYLDKRNRIILNVIPEKK